MYGVGENERLLSKVLATRRDEVVLATKFGNVRAPNGDFLRIDGSPEYVAQACDASLQRLGVDYIDMYYQHRVDRNVPIEDPIGEIGRAQGRERRCQSVEISVGGGTLKKKKK